MLNARWPRYSFSVQPLPPKSLLMRYSAALITFLMIAAASLPAAAGQHGHDGPRGGHGGHGHDGRGHGHGGGNAGVEIIVGPRGHGPDMAPGRPRFHRVMPLGRILGSIRRHHPGRMSDVRGPFPGPNGEPHLRVKWFTPEGRVVWLDVDATTGEVWGVNGARRRDRGGE